MNNLTEPVVTIVSGILVVAILAVLVSRNSATPSVLQAAGSAFSNALGVAVSPVSGSNFTPSGAYPSATNIGSLGLASLPNLG